MLSGRLRRFRHASQRPPHAPVEQCERGQWILYDCCIFVIVLVHSPAHAWLHQHYQLQVTSLRYAVLT